MLIDQLLAISARRFVALALGAIIIPTAMIAIVLSAKKLPCQPPCRKRTVSPIGPTLRKSRGQGRPPTFLTMIYAIAILRRNSNSYHPRYPETFAPSVIQTDCALVAFLQAPEIQLRAIEPIAYKYINDIMVLMGKDCNGGGRKRNFGNSDDI